MDPSGWYEGKHHYDDPENRYIFVFEGTPSSGEITYNTKLVNPSEIKSYWDLLNPKWKGKSSPWTRFHLRPDQRGANLFYKHPDLGPEFLRRLHAETDMTILRSNEQIWIGSARENTRSAIGAQQRRHGHDAGSAAQSISARVARKKDPPSPRITAP